MGVSGFSWRLLFYGGSRVSFSKPTTRGESHSLLRPPPTSRSQLMSSNVQNAFCPRTLCRFFLFSKRCVVFLHLVTIHPTRNPSPMRLLQRAATTRADSAHLRAGRKLGRTSKKCDGCLVQKDTRSKRKADLFVSTLCSFSSYHLSFTSHEILQEHQRYLFIGVALLGTCQAFPFVLCLAAV